MKFSFVGSLLCDSVSKSEIPKFTETFEEHADLEELISKETRGYSSNSNSSNSGGGIVVVVIVVVVISYHISKII